METSILLAVVVLAASGKPQVSLDDLAAGKGWKVFNRTVTAAKEDGRTVVRFDERPGMGVAWIEGLDFTDGVIEVDIKGRDVDQKSFLGVAFRGVDDTTYDAVYFRPFNFRSDDPVRRSHAVQYISQPTNTWKQLRTDHPGAYEKSVHPTPDPQGWFHARIVLAKPKVSVYVDNAAEPSLVVDELTDRKGGWVGLWLGDDSDGAFANLKIKK